MIAAVLANIHRDRKQHPQPYTWEDFLRPKPKEKQAWWQMLGVVELWATARGDVDQRPNKTA